MAIDFMTEASPQIKDYLFYLQTVRGKSPKTVDEYFSDLRTFSALLKEREILFLLTSSFPKYLLTILMRI